MTNLIYKKTQQFISHLIDSNVSTVVPKKPSKLSYFFKKTNKANSDVEEVNEKITNVINVLLDKFTNPLKSEYQYLLKSNPHAQFYANYHEIITQFQKQFGIEPQFYSNIKEEFNELDFEIKNSQVKKLPEQIAYQLDVYKQKLAHHRTYLTDQQIRLIEMCAGMKNGTSTHLKIKLEKLSGGPNTKEYVIDRLSNKPSENILKLPEFTYRGNIKLSFGLIGDFQFFESLAEDQQKQLIQAIEQEFSSFYQGANKAQMDPKNTYFSDNKVSFFAKQPVPAGTVTNYFAPIAVK